jgi:hypothetical protein
MINPFPNAGALARFHNQPVAGRVASFTCGMNAAAGFKGRKGPGPTMADTKIGFLLAIPWSYGIF